MSAGATLLKLQQIDLELARNKSELANMPALISSLLLSQSTIGKGSVF